MTCGGPIPRDVGTASDHDHKQFIMRTGQTKHAYICVLTEMISGAANP